MSTIQEPQLRCNEQTVSDEYRRWVKSRMPQMAALLDKLDEGASPNFLDIMAGISNLVAFCTECDQKTGELPEENFYMSGKFCRFCC